MCRWTSSLALIVTGMVACKTNTTPTAPAAGVTSASGGTASTIRIADDAGPAGAARIVASLDHLPATTMKIGDLFIQFTSEKDPKTRQQLTSAYLGSHFCLQEVPEPTMALLSPLQVASSLSAERLPALRALLQCGSALQKSLLSPYVTVVRFTVLGSPVDARFIQLDRSELPAEFGFVPQIIEGLPGYCQTEAAGGCNFQSIHIGTTWVFGRSTAVSVVARAQKSNDPRDFDAALSTTIQTGFEALEPLTQRHVSLTAKTPGQTLRITLSAIEGTMRMGEREPLSTTETLPREIEAALDAIASSNVASGYAFDPPSATQVNGTYALIAQSENAARTLLGSTVLFVERWKGSLAGSASTALVRAIRKIVPTRRGRVVSFAIQEPLTTTEAATALARERSMNERKESVARIFAAVLAGEPLPPSDVNRLTDASASTR
jgi:hypothetical protein